MIALVVLILATYGGVIRNSFVDFDDGEYVYANPMVLAGVSARGVAWAFTTVHAANWHPLTWLSHQLDVELFDTWAGGHHLTNVAIHALSTVLLFLLLNWMTAATGASALTAALFAVHPLHVESVAWVAERKDLLCALFWLAATASYVGWVRKPSSRRYFGMILAFAAALMSKPMAVTFPFALLLLDAWPLSRLASLGDLPARLREKAPLFALTALSCAITLWAQAALGATATLATFPVGARLANASVAVAQYLRQISWPSALAVFYPHPASVGREVPIALWSCSAALVVIFTVVACRQALRRPWLTFGWLWFLGLLVPVLGFVQVGSQARADRYTYLPSIGLFVVLAWTGDEVARRWAACRRPILAVAIVGVVALAGVARAQVANWRDATTLYLHALKVTEENWLAWNNLGIQRLDRGEYGPALEAFSNAKRIKSDYADAWYNSGVAHSRLGDLDSAVADYRTALQLDGSNADGWVNLGLALVTLGQPDEAGKCLVEALALRASDALALANLALLEATAGHLEQARSLHLRLRAVDPEMALELERRIGELARP